LDAFASTAYLTDRPDARVSGPICGSQDPNSPQSFLFGTSFIDVFGNSGSLLAVVPELKGQNPANCSAVLDGARPVSFWEVLTYPVDTDATYGEFASVVAAAYLNALNDQTFPVRPGQVIHMWNDGLTGGYCPTSGCTGTHIWDVDRIIFYLVSTWS
jgi:hypothetical protein